MGDLVHLRWPARSQLHAMRHARLAHGVEKPRHRGGVHVLRLSPHAIEAAELDACHDAERTTFPSHPPPGHCSSEELPCAHMRARNLVRVEAHSREAMPRSACPPSPALRGNMSRRDLGTSRPHIRVAGPTLLGRPVLDARAVDGAPFCGGKRLTFRACAVLRSLMSRILSC